MTTITTATAPTLAVIDGIPTTTSNELAQHFGKSHDNVMRQIKTIITGLKNEASEFTAHNFAVSEYTDSAGRKLPAYRLTRDGFTLLAMGFTGKRALQFKLAYIYAFNKMEAQLTNKPCELPPSTLTS